MITARPLRSGATASSLLKRPTTATMGSYTAAAAAARSRVTAPLTAVRHKSGPYGYTQAKALVFSKTGEPGDVLKCV